VEDTLSHPHKKLEEYTSVYFYLCSYTANGKTILDRMVAGEFISYPFLVIILHSVEEASQYLLLDPTTYLRLIKILCFPLQYTEYAFAPQKHLFNNDYENIIPKLYCIIILKPQDPHKCNLWSK
jgi:hypothetical protein